MNIPSVQASPASSALKGDAGFELGEELGNLKAFSAGASGRNGHICMTRMLIGRCSADASTDLDPQTRGELLTNAEKVREGEQHVARPDLLGDVPDALHAMSVHNSFARSDPFHLDEPDPTSSEDAYRVSASTLHTLRRE